MKKLKVRILEALTEVPALAWDALVGAAGSPFLEWRFLQALEEAGCVTPETGWQPLHLTIWEEPDAAGAERLVAAAPAYVKGHSQGEFVFDWEWASLAQRLGVRYYPKLVVGVPFTPAGGARLLVHPELPEAQQRALRRLLCDTLRGVAEDLGLSSVHVLFHPAPRRHPAPRLAGEPPESSADAEALAEAGFLRRAGVQFHWNNRGYRDFDDYLSRFNAKRRHMLRRERAEVGKAGIQVHTRRGAFTTADAEDMHQLYVSTVDKFYYGQRYLNPRFFQLMTERMADRLEFVVAQTAPGQPLLGGAINFAKAGRLYGRYWGQGEPAHRFLHFEVCYYHSLAECIARGLTVFEPGAGGEHKVARGFEPTLTYSAHLVFDRRLCGLLKPHLQREEAAIAAAVAEAQAESPLRAEKPG